MGGIVMAWLFGEGLVTWRWWKAGAPPTPGSYALSSGAFMLCALLAVHAPARTAATMLAVGLDVAALLKVLPGSNVSPDKNWPPPVISDPNVLLPNGKQAPPNPNPSGGSGPGGGLPTGPNTLPPGTPVPPGSGVVFPPGSSYL